MVKRFFQIQVVPEPTPQVPPSMVRVDCGFKALSIGLLDHILHQPRAHQEAFRKILEQHFQYFPEHQPTQNLLTVAEKIQILTQRLPLGECINLLAYTLRQMAVDEILSHPTYYRKAFPYPLLSPQEMRHPQTPMSNLALIALAHRLQLPLTLRISSLGQELPYSQTIEGARYHPLNNPEVIVHQSERLFFAEVYHEQHFKSAALTSPLELKSHHRFPEDPSVQALEDCLKQDHDLKQERYEHFLHRLNTLLTTHELTEAHLIDLYIEHLNHIPLLGEKTMAGIEYEHQDLFAIETPEPLSVCATSIAETLITALARAIALEQIQDNIFDKPMSSVQP